MSIFARADSNDTSGMRPQCFPWDKAAQMLNFTRFLRPGFSNSMLQHWWQAYHHPIIHKQASCWRLSFCLRQWTRYVVMFMSTLEGSTTWAYDVFSSVCWRGCRQNNCKSVFQQRISGHAVLNTTFTTKTERLHDLNGCCKMCVGVSQFGLCSTHQFIFCTTCGVT